MAPEGRPVYRFSAMGERVGLSVVVVALAALPAGAFARSDGADATATKKAAPCTFSVAGQRTIGSGLFHFAKHRNGDRMPCRRIVAMVRWISSHNRSFPGWSCFLSSQTCVQALRGRDGGGQMYWYAAY
jgi:hypothetical protein